MKRASYSELLTRLFRASLRQCPVRAALIGVWWERWKNRQAHF